MNAAKYIRSSALEDVQICILLGGEGTRIRHRTGDLPKSLLRIGSGVPFLSILLSHLRNQGFRRFVLLVGRQGQAISELVTSNQLSRETVRYSSDPRPLGTGGALARARSLLDERFILLFGDTLATVDYFALWNQALHGSSPMTMVVAPTSIMGRTKGNVVVVKDAVADYRKIGNGNYNHIDAGVMILDRDILQGLANWKPASLENTIYQSYANRGLIQSFEISEPFYDIGTEVGFLSFKQKWANCPMVKAELPNMGLEQPVVLSARRSSSDR